MEFGTIRHLHLLYPNLQVGEYLELEVHWADILDQLLEQLCTCTGIRLQISAFRIACVDVLHLGNGDTEGSGEIRLPIARQNQNHFVPLIRIRGSAHSSTSLHGQGLND